MITIKEAKPRKLSGQTSLQITFKYNQVIVETIKALPFAIYHKEDFTWEVPTCYLAEVLDKLTFIDSIQLSLYSPERNSGNFELTEDELAFLNNRTYKPMKHQIEAINFMLKTGKSLLLDGCGVGKSCEMIWYAEILKRRKLIDHCLVICGICSLRGNWENEIAKFSNESSVVIGKHVTKNNTVRYTSISERAKQISEKLDEFFVIINLETLRDKRIIDAIKKSKTTFGLIAFDEAHKCLTGDMTVLTDQGEFTIAELYNMDDMPKVLSYNKKKDINEFRQITSITRSDPTEKLLELVIDDAGASCILRCTESHKVYTTNRGWIKAKDLTEADDIKLAKFNRDPQRS